MRAFEYASAATKQQAVSLLSGTMGDAEILAGGTDLLSLIKDDILAPKRLVNIKEIKELGGIRSAGGGLRIGALTTIEEVADSSLVRQAYPGLAQAAAEIAGPQIRHMATVGGNLCQRPRCWYFRNGFGLLGQDKNGKSLVLEGDNRYHAILGNSGPAYFVHPSSLAPALIALNAKIRIFGPAGERDLPLEQFYTVPKSASDRENVLQAQEVLTEVVVPAAKGVRGATYEVRQKDAFDWPLALASVALKMSAGKVQSARIVMGHVAPVPWRSQEAEQALVGKGVDEASAKAAGEAAVQGARDLGHNAYKIQLAKVAVKRAILKAAKGTPV